MKKLVDLRRDTNTLPTEEMKEAAFRSPLGDAVYGEIEGKESWRN